MMMKSSTSSSRGESRPKAKNIWMPLILILLVIAGGGLGYFYWNQKTTTQAEAAGGRNTAAGSKITTSKVKTGSITLAASGTVTLVAGQESDLAFTVSGTVARLNVTVGDQVKKDQVLAQLDNLEALQADIKTAEQNLLSAQQDLATFKSNAPANLANAELKVITAQDKVDTAQSSVVQKNWQRCDGDTKEAYYIAYTKAVDKLNALGDGGGSADYYLNKILPQKKVVDQAKAAYASCAGYTDYQVASTNANLALAQAELKQAQEDLDALKQNNGLDSIQLATNENNVTTAQMALDSAKDALAGATLTAPFDGTVLTVSGKAGDTVTVDAKTTRVVFITIADLAHPVLQYAIDETDMEMVAVGETAQVIFDAFADRTFTGSVTRVDPALTTSDSASSVSGLIKLDLTKEADVPAFPKNLTGSVLIIHGSAENVLTVPVQALQQQSDGSYAVSVVGADGQTTLKPVEVGLMDVASAEIKSGLTLGETVVTGTVQAN
jgi:multidrug efflux pump subunit AcrA (membrane-fusion protein)